MSGAGGAAAACRIKWEPWTRAFGGAALGSERAGRGGDTSRIQAGDEIVEVDGVDVKSAALSELRRLLFGPVGTKVSMRMRRYLIACVKRRSTGKAWECL